MKNNPNPKLKRNDISNNMKYYTDVKKWINYIYFNKLLGHF